MPPSHLPANQISDIVISGLLLLIPIVILLYLALRRDLVHPNPGLRGSQPPSEINLAPLAAAMRAINAAPLDQEELAEVIYLETASIVESDDFQLGAFEGMTFRPWIWIRDGDRQPNAQIASREDIYEQVRRSRQTLYLTNAPDHSHSAAQGVQGASGEEFASTLVLPLLQEGECIGLLAVRSRKSRAFSVSQRLQLEILASSTSHAISAISAITEVDDRTLQLLLLQEVSRRLISLQPLPERLTQVVHLLREAFDYASVQLYESDGENALGLWTESSRQLQEGEAGRTQAPPIVARALEESQAAIQTGSLGEAADLTRHRIQFAVPLKVEDRIMGVLYIECDSQTRLPSDEMALVEMIAGQTAIAILEARNYAQQQEDAWLTAVLLEVTRHAAQPGDPDAALQAVLQLTTLLAGADWAVLLLADEDERSLRLGTFAGTRQPLDMYASTLQISTALFNLQPPFQENTQPQNVPLPEVLRERLGSEEALALVLSDGITLLGLLLIAGEQISERRHPLLTGIAHQISLRLENSRLIEEAAARRSFEREVAMARSIQASLIPEFIPSHPDWEVGATWAVARDMGGDFYDFISLPGATPRWGIVIADVADKGIPAALYMALSRTLMRSVAGAEHDPGSALEHVNEILLADTRTDLFVSLFYAVWDPGSGVLSYANAGHNPPLLLRPETRAQFLSEHSMVLGVEKGIRYKTHRIELEPAQLLVLYTDGVTEAANERQEFFGLHRLESLILGSEPWRAQEVANRIEQRVKDFCGMRDLSDDLTAVTLLRLT